MTDGDDSLRKRRQAVDVLYKFYFINQSYIFHLLLNRKIGLGKNYN